MKKYISILILLMFSSSSYALRKVALVIGNSQYTHAEYLPIPANDANAMARQLRRLGFDTIKGIDVSKGEMKALLNRFSRKLTADSIALFYYAGHGIQSNDKNYLIPVNADIQNAYELEDAGMNFDIVLQALNSVNPELAVAMIDACRDNPFEKRYRNLTRGIEQHGEGLADVRSKAGGTILSYATEPGRTAMDGKGEHSPYTSALLKYIKVPGLSVHDMLNEVGLEVLRTTNQNQKPWIASSPVKKFCFAGCDISKSEKKKRNQNEKIDNLKFALQIGDLDTIKKIAKVNEQQHKTLEDIFAAYETFSVNIKKTRKNQLGKKQDQIASILFTEAVNRKGNRVIPSDKWNTMSLILK